LGLAGGCFHFGECFVRFGGAPVGVAGLHFGDTFIGFRKGESFAEGLRMMLAVREAAKEQLREVAESDGVLAVDVLVGELFGDVAEQGVDVASGSEVAGLVEEFGGESFRVGLSRRGLLQVIRAKRIVTRCDEHAAATTASVDVIALIGVWGFFRHRKFLSNK
jgi:hypothetical protein